MGFLDHYRQYRGMTDEEVQAELHARAAEERAKALARVEALDLSRTTWHEFPAPDVVAAITYAARRAINEPPDPHAEELRQELARRNGLEPERVAVGNGAADLLRTAADQLLMPGDELVTPWPSYPLFPLMARRAGASAVPVPGFDPDALLSAVNERTRIVAIANPNDPTGEHLRADELATLLARLPERVVVLLDEALADYVTAEPATASLHLLDDFPRLLIVRTFSKAHALSSLKVGYVLGGPGSEPLLETLAPPAGISGLSQVAALESLRKCAQQVAGRRAQVEIERDRLLAGLGDLPVDVTPSQANVLWIRARSLAGAELRARLQRFGVIVRGGHALGSDDHVRVTVRDAPSTDRTLRAFAHALGEA